MSAEQLPPPLERHWREDLRLLRQRNLGLLTAARLTSSLGSGIAPIALAFGVLALPGGDAGSLGLVLFAAALPRLLFMLVGGVIADRVDRSRLMVVAELLAAAGQLAAGALFLTGHATVPWLVALAALNGTAVALFYPALTGLVPDVATDDELQSANALLRLASNLAAILGTAIGGILVARVGPGWALVVDALTFAVSAGLIAAIRTRTVARSAAPASMLTDLVHGWREFSSRRWVVVVVVLFSLMNVGFSAAVGVLGPVRALESWGGASSWALVLASFSLGTVAGVVLALRLRPARPLLLAMGVSPVFALPVVALAVPMPLGVVVVLAFASGVSVDVFEVLWQTALQQHIPRESLSRVSAYDWLGSTAFVPLGLAVTGAVVAWVGLDDALWICAVLTSLGVLGLLEPQVRQLRAGRPRADGAVPAEA